jgi:FkbM family methyltransferase
MKLGRLKSADEFLRSWLVANYETFRRFFPNRYFVFRCDGGKLSLNLKEHLGMFRRALRVYEREKMDAVRKLATPGSVFVDVGGNIGDFSLLAASVVGKKGRVLCFEPEPGNFQAIQRNIKLNAYTNIELYQVALSDRDGEASLYLGVRCDYHTLLDGQSFRGAGAIKVTTRDLDSLLRETGVQHVDMIKIDVEGAEMQVLKGAAETLDANPDIILLLELHPQLGVRPQDIRDFLERHGLSLYRMSLPYNISLEMDDNIQDLLVHRPWPAAFEGFSNTSHTPLK